MMQFLFLTGFQIQTCEEVLRSTSILRQAAKHPEKYGDGESKSNQERRPSNHKLCG